LTSKLESGPQVTRETGAIYTSILGFLELFAQMDQDTDGQTGCNTQCGLL